MTEYDWSNYFDVLRSILDKIDRWKKSVKPMLNEEQWLATLDEQHTLIAELTEKPYDKTQEIMANMEEHRKRWEKVNARSSN